MWYEAMPALVIIGTLMASYQVGSIYITKAFWGKPYRKDQETSWTRHLSERDKRLTGCDMILAGIENIK